MQAKIAEMLRWDDIQILLALARAGSLKGAAQALGVNASTMSRRLTGVEEVLKMTFFDRTSDGLRATSALEELVPLAEAVEHAVSNFSRALDGFESTPTGTVRVTAPPGVIEHLIAPKLAGFRESYPGIALDLDGSIGYADLTRREADIALRSSRPQSGDLIATRLGQARDIVLASAKVVGRLGELESLEAIEWITWANELALFSSAQWVSRQVPADRIVLRTNRVHAQIAAASAGLGAMLQPETYRDFPGLSPLPLARALKKRILPLPAHELWLVGHQALRNVPRVAAVWDFLLALFRESPIQTSGRK
jgi:DNA-binding transcriptional LysR family regulator